MTDDEKRQVKDAMLAGEQLYERLIIESRQGAPHLSDQIQALDEIEAKWNIAISFMRDRINKSAASRRN